MLQGFEDKLARAICTFGYCEGPGKEVKIFQGITEGKIVPSRGPTNFGWDSVLNLLDLNKLMLKWTKVSRIPSVIDLEH